MPTIATLKGCSIRVYFKDHNPPHVHIYSTEGQAKYRIADSAMIDGDLPAKYQRQVRAWLDDNREFALRKWREIAEA